MVMSNQQKQTLDDQQFIDYLPCFNKKDENHDRSESNEGYFGNQFDAERFSQGRDNEEMIRSAFEVAFDVHNLISVEPESPYDNFADEKEIHQVIDYTGIDYLIDPFDSPLFGINHRTHSPSNMTLRFDMRAKTGTKAPSELEKLLHSESGDIVPKYASRMKKSKDEGIEWFRIVDLHTFKDAIENEGLKPDKMWTDGSVEAWMFDYSTLDKYDMVVWEFKD